MRVQRQRIDVAQQAQTRSHQIVSEFSGVGVQRETHPVADPAPLGLHMPDHLATPVQDVGLAIGPHRPGEGFA